MNTENDVRSRLRQIDWPVVISLFVIVTVPAFFAWQIFGPDADDQPVEPAAQVSPPELGAAPSATASTSAQPRVWQAHEIPPKDEMTVEYFQRVMDVHARLDEAITDAILDTYVDSPRHREAALKLQTADSYARSVSNLQRAAEQGQTLIRGRSAFVVESVVATPRHCALIEYLVDDSMRKGVDHPTERKYAMLLQRTKPSRSLTAWELAGTLSVEEGPGLLPECNPAIDTTDPEVGQ